MSHCEDVRKLTDGGISQDLFMLHGSSIEAVIELAKTGKLPSGRTYFFEEENRYIKDPGLYFTPVTSKFSSKYFSENIDREGCIRSSESYAKGIAFANYLARRLGCQTPEAFSVIAFDWKTEWKKNKNWRSVNEKLRKNGIDVSLRQMRALHSNAIKRKGAIIEPNESIFELGHRPSGVLYEDSMFVECPDGLDIRYIGGIGLLGPVEERIMRRFIGANKKGSV
jgi:hypothetical protein